MPAAQGLDSLALPRAWAAETLGGLELDLAWSGRVIVCSPNATSAQFAAQFVHVLAQPSVTVV